MPSETKRLNYFQSNSDYTSTNGYGSASSISKRYRKPKKKEEKQETQANTSTTRSNSSNQTQSSSTYSSNPIQDRIEKMKRDIAQNPDKYKVSDDIRRKINANLGGTNVPSEFADRPASMYNSVKSNRKELSEAVNRYRKDKGYFDPITVTDENGNVKNYDDPIVESIRKRDEEAVADTYLSEVQARQSYYGDTDPFNGYTPGYNPTEGMSPGDAAKYITDRYQPEGELVTDIYGDQVRKYRKRSGAPADDPYFAQQRGNDPFNGQYVYVKEDANGNPVQIAQSYLDNATKDNRPGKDTWNLPYVTQSEKDYASRYGTDELKQAAESNNKSLYLKLRYGTDNQDDFDYDNYVAMTTDKETAKVRQANKRFNEAMKSPEARIAYAQMQYDIQNKHGNKSVSEQIADKLWGLGPESSVSPMQRYQNLQQKEINAPEGYNIFNWGDDAITSYRTNLKEGKITAQEGYYLLQEEKQSYARDYLKYLDYQDIENAFQQMTSDPEFNKYLNLINRINNGEYISDKSPYSENGTSVIYSKSNLPKAPESLQKLVNLLMTKGDNGDPIILDEDGHTIEDYIKNGGTFPLRKITQFITDYRANEKDKLYKSASILESFEDGGSLPMNWLFNWENQKANDSLEGLINGTADQKRQILNKFIEASKNIQKEYQTELKDLIKDRDEYTEKNKVSDYYKYKEQTASDDIFSVDNWLYKQPGQQGYSNSSWEKNMASLALRFAAGVAFSFSEVAPVAAPVAGILEAGGVVVGMSASEPEQGSEVQEGYKQRLQNKLQEYVDVDGNASNYSFIPSFGTKDTSDKKTYLDLMIEEAVQQGVKLDPKLSIDEAFDKIIQASVTGEYTPKNLQLISKMAESTQGSNTLYNRDMIAVAQGEILESIFDIGTMGLGGKTNVVRSAGKSVGSSLDKKLASSSIGSVYNFAKGKVDDVIYDAKLFKSAYKNVADGIVDHTKFLTSIPNKMLDKVYDTAKLGVKGRLAANTAVNIGKMTVGSSISEAIEEGNQWQNQHEWIEGNLNAEQETFVTNVVRNFMTSAKSAYVLAGIPLGIESESNAEMIANMKGGAIGGGVHTAAMRSVTSSIGLYKDIKFSNIINEALVAEKESNTARLNSAFSFIKKGFSNGKYEDLINRQFDAFAGANRTRQNNDQEFIPQDIIENQRKRALDVVNMSRSKEYLELADNLGIKVKNKLGGVSNAYASFISSIAFNKEKLQDAKNKYNDAKRESDDLFESVYSRSDFGFDEANSLDINGEIDNASNAVAQKRADELSSLFNPVDNLSEKEQLSRQHSILTKIGSVLQQLHTLEEAERLDPDHISKDSKYVKQILNDRLNYFKQFIKEDRLEEVLKDPKSFLIDSRYYDQLSEAYQKQLMLDIDRQYRQGVYNMLHGVGKNGENTSKKVKEYLDSIGAAQQKDQQLLQEIEDEYRSRFVANREEEIKQAAEAQAEQQRQQMVDDYINSTADVSTNQEESDDEYDWYEDNGIETAPVTISKEEADKEWKEFKKQLKDTYESSMKQAGVDATLNVYESASEASQDSHKEGDKAVIVDKNNKTSVLLTAVKSNDKTILVDSYGIPYIVDGEVLTDQQRDIERQNAKTTINPTQKNALDAIEYQSKVEQARVVGVSGNTYFIKEDSTVSITNNPDGTIDVEIVGGTVKMYTAVDTVTGDKYEENDSVKQRKSDIINKVKQFVEKNDVDGLKDYVKSLQNPQLYIDYLNQNAEDVDAVAKAIAEEMVSESYEGVVVDNIIKNIIQIFFTNKKSLNYNTLKINVEGVDIPVKQLISKDKYDLFIDSLNQLKAEYDELGYVITTSDNVWHNQLVLENGKCVRVAGKQDLIAVDNDGKIHLIDCKSSQYSFTKIDGFTNEFEDITTLNGKQSTMTFRQLYSQRMSLKLALMQKSIEDVEFAENPLEIIPTVDKYSRRYKGDFSVLDLIDGIKNKKNIPEDYGHVIDHLIVGYDPADKYFSELSLDIPKQPTRISLQVDNNIVSGRFNTQQENKDKINNLNSILSDLDNDLSNQIQSLERYKELAGTLAGIFEPCDSILDTILDKLNQIEQFLSQENIDQAQQLITSVTQDLQTLKEQSERIYYQNKDQIEDSKNTLTPTPVIDERQNDFAEVNKLHTIAYNLLNEYNSNRSLDKLAELQNAISNLNRAIEAFEQKYDNPTEVRIAKQFVEYFNQQNNKPQPVPTSSGRNGWQYHNTASRRDYIDDDTLPLRDALMNPDFQDESVCEVESVSADNKHVKCTITYKGHTYKNIDIQVAITQEGQSFVENIKNQLQNKKESEKVVLTGMNRTGGRTDETKGLVKLTQVFKDIFGINTNENQSVFGFAQMDEGSGQIRVTKRSSLQGGRNPIYTFARGKGSVGSVYMVVTPEFNNQPGFPVEPIIAPIISSTINEDEANWIVEQLTMGWDHLNQYIDEYSSPNTSVYPNLPFTNLDIIKMMIPYGVCGQNGNTAEHVYLKDGVVTFTRRENGADVKDKWNIYTQADQIKQHLMKMRINIDMKRAESFLGEANDPTHPFNSINKWFKRHNIQSIKIGSGNSRITFNQSDFSNPNNSSDKLGLSGLGWMANNEMLETSVINNPRFSYTSSTVINEDAKQQQNMYDDQPQDGAIPDIDEDEAGLDIDIDEFDDFDFDVPEKRQRGKAKVQLDESVARKRIAKILGKKFPVTVSENIHNLIPTLYPSAVGALYKAAIYLQTNAENGVEWHEAFHAVSRLLLPDVLRRQVYKGITKAVNKRFKIDLSTIQDKETRDYIIDEYGADFYMEYMLGKENIRFDVKHIFDYIKQHVEAIQKIGSYRLYLMYLTMNSGAFKHVSAKHNLKEIHDKDQYVIHGRSFKYVMNDHMYESLKKSIVYYLLKSQNQRMDGKSLDIDTSDPDKKFERRKRNGKTLDMSLREYMTQGEQTIAKQAVNELFDNWDVVRDDIEATMREIGIDRDFVAEQKRIEDLNGDPESIAEGMEHNYDQASYEVSHLFRATTGIKFFTSLIKSKRNELGFWEFRDSNDVLLRMINDLHMCKTPSQMIAKMEMLAHESGDNAFMYKEILKIVKDYYDHQTKINKNTGERYVWANNEQFITQLFNLLSCSDLSFKRVEASLSKSGWYMQLSDCGQDYESYNHRLDWGGLLSYGGTLIFSRDQNGDIQFRYGDRSLTILTNIFTGLRDLRNQFTEENINRIKRDKERGKANTFTLRMNGNNVNIDVTTEQGVKDAKQYLISALNAIGIEFGLGELDYMLEQKYGKLTNNPTGFEGLSLFFNESGEAKIEKLWESEVSLMKQVGGKMVPSFNLKHGIIKSNNETVDFQDTYAHNAFAVELSTYKYKYDHIFYDKNVLVSNSKKFYAISENNYITDTTDELSEGGAILDILKKDCYNYVELMTLDGDKLSEPKTCGSVIIKQQSSSDKQELKFHTLVNFKTNANQDEGADYFGIGEREDYVLKAKILSEGGLIFPTMSDKKTWGFLTGVTLPGIQITHTSRRDIKAVNVPTNSNFATGKIEFGQDVIDQMMEYAYLEYMKINQTITKIENGLIKEEDKIGNFHKGPSVEDKDKVKHMIPNGCVFSSLTGVYGKDGKFISFNNALTENGEYISYKQNLETAEKEFFSKTEEEQRELMRQILQRQVYNELSYLESIGLVERIPGTYRYKNIGLDNQAISAIAKSLTSDGRVDESIMQNALMLYVADIVTKSTMSIQEVERVYSGHPGFFKFKYDKKGHLVNRSEDEFKRFGGLGSTGTNNNIEIVGAPKDYTCAEINDDEVGSKQADYIKQLMSEGEWRQAYKLHLIDQGISKQEASEKSSSHAENVLSVDQIKSILEKENKTVYEIVEKKIEAETSSYYSGINIADGSAFISPQMTEWLLRMCGKYSKRIQGAFRILNDPKADIAKQAEAYKAVQTEVIGAQKYTAYGMRLSSDGSTCIPYYHKMALFPLFRCVATGKMQQVLDRMENNEEPVHMLMMKSAVKFGNQGTKPYSDEEGFSFNTYKVPFNRIRKQFNTDPKEKEEIKMGTQMVKVALASLDLFKTYVTTNGELSGQMLLDRIMSNINKLAEYGENTVREAFFTNGKLDQQKLSEWLKQNLSERDADSSIIEAIDGAESHGEFVMNQPIAATSKMGWLQSILTSFINDNIVKIKTPGSALYQRSIWKMEGETVNVTGIDHLPEALNNGEDLQMIIDGENDPAKGAMDCVLTMDYFHEVLKEAGLSNASFEEQRKALIEAGIIGKQAPSMFVGYRIPTQAQSSIHCLRCVDVIPVLRHNIFLPKEFTKITGSDFDIDKIYVASYNVKMKQEDGHWTLDNAALSERQTIQNELIGDYITILRDIDNAHISHRSIDNDTSLVDDVIDDLYQSGSKESVQPYEFYQLRSQVKTKTEFLTGKVGIGPYALNNNSHILTLLYGVKFKITSLMSVLGHGDLDRVLDDDGQSISSWLSALINIHVDAAKDPKMKKLNLNPMTYNLSNLLIRTGYGKRTFDFLRQEVMLAMADEYVNASGTFMSDPGQSKYMRQQEAKRRAAEKICSKSSLEAVEKIFKEDDEYTQVAINVLKDSMNGKKFTIRTYTTKDKYTDSVVSDNVLHYLAKNKLNNNQVVVVGGYQFNYQCMQACVFFMDEMLAEPAKAISDLVKYSKIDTEKQGSTVTEQLVYLRGVAECFGDRKLLEDLYDRIGQNGALYNSQFEQEGLNRMYKKSFLKDKTRKAIYTFMNILNGQIFEASPGFQNQLYAVCNALHVKDAKSIQKVADAMTAKIKAEAIANYAQDNGINIKDLVSGNHTVFDKLHILKAAIRTDDKYKDIRDENNEPKNKLLKMLTAGTKKQYDYKLHIKDNVPLDTFSDFKFLKIFDSLDSSSSKTNDLIEAWKQLLEDGSHPEIQQFARELFVYAFVTSADNQGKTKFFNYVPNSLRQSSGYVDYIRTMLDNSNKGIISFLDEYEMMDDICLNNWRDDTFVPTVRLNGKGNIKYKGMFIEKEIPSQGVPTYPVMLTTDVNTPVLQSKLRPYVKVKRSGEDDGFNRSYTVFKLAYTLPVVNGYVIPIYTKVNPRSYHFDGGYDFYQYGNMVTPDYEYTPDLFDGGIDKIIEKIQTNIDAAIEEFGEDFVNAFTEAQSALIESDIDEQVIPTPLNMQPEQLTSEPEINIYAGTGENTDLSNFAERPFDNGFGEHYISVEQYFHVEKLRSVLDYDTQEAADAVYAQIDRILNAKTSAKAKQLGDERIPGTKFNESEWKKIRENIMYDGMLMSFIQNPKALKRLLDTGNAKFTHNQASEPYKSLFPKVLTKVRNDLQNDEFLRRKLVQQYGPDEEFDKVYNYIKSDDIFSDEELKQGEEFKNNCKGN